MVSEQNTILKGYLKSVLEFVILPIPPAFFNGEINQWAVPLSEKQRILFTFFAINAKLKMHKNANSKCTILAKHRLEEYTPLWRCEYERAKGHFREGEAFNEREF